MKQNKTATLQALVLDFGSVISLTMFETHAQTERELGLEPGSLTWMGPFDPENDPLWQQLEAGKISQRDYWLTRSQEVGAMIGEQWTTMMEFVKRARGSDPMSIMRPPMLELIAQAHHSGCKTAILSNELDLFFGDDIRGKLPFLSQFDVIVDATYTQILKPDPKAYQLCLDQLDLEADQCVFIDDQLNNVQGANAVGMHGLHLDVFKPQLCIDAAKSLLGLT
ncbi:MAG: HAD family phosphatase [Pseudomonadales bacterium]|nr:HAD family phosphatase [Pseudomonadales bacterium]NRA14140.1 HAD family phosphatase [Oceanospirillaceae bacterium]